MPRKAKKVYPEYKQTFAVEKVSIGYDKVIRVLEDVIAKETETLWYPPYNIRKNGSSEYIIDVEVTGYNKEDIVAKIEGGALIVTAPGKILFEDPEGDDVWYHQGIFPGGELYAKFYIADTVELASADYDDGILTFKFKESVKSTVSKQVPIGPFASPEEAKPFVPVFNSAGEIVGKKDETTGENVLLPVSEPAPVEVLPEREEVTTVVNDDTKKEPTVEVTVLDPMPQVVEVKLEEVTSADSANTKTQEPQASVVLVDASHEIVPDEVVIEVIKTEEGKADIVVAIPTEVAQTLEEKGIDVTAAIEAAIVKEEVTLPEAPVVDLTETTTVYPELEGGATPVAVEVPAELPTVVEVKVEDNVVKFEEVAADIPVEAAVIPVVTAEAEHDAVLVVTPETQEKLDELGVTIPDVTDVLVKEETPVVISEPVVEVAPEVPADVVPVVVNAEVETAPTVTVLVPEVLPQIVEVTLDHVAETIDTTDTASQVEITLADATHEVVSDAAELHVIKTEDQKSDIVVAVPEEVKVALEEAGVDVKSVVEEAVASAAAESAVVLPEVPVVVEAPKVEVELETTTPETTILEVPDVIPQVVQVVVNEEVPVDVNSNGEVVETGTKVTLEDVSGNIPADAELTPVITAEGEHDIVVAIAPEDKEKLEASGLDPVAVIEEALQNNETEVTTVDTFSHGEVEPTVVAPEQETLAPEPVAEEVVEEAPVAVATETAGVPGLPGSQSGPAPEVAETVVVVNQEDSEKPTVELRLPEVLPQIVEVAVEHVEPAVDAESSEPQVVVTVSDATYEVQDNTTLETVKTEEGKADVVVSIPEEAKRELEAAGVDIVADIATAITEEHVDAPALPEETVVEEAPKTEVELVPEEATLVVPEVVAPVMEAVVTEPATEEAPVTIELVPASESIPETAELVPVVTKEGENDIVVAVTSEVAAELPAELDLSQALSDAVIEAEAEVVKTE